MELHTQGTANMLKNPHIGPMYRAFLDSRYCPEIYVYMDEAMKKRDPKTQFKKFFADNAPYAINVTGESLVAAKRLGAAKDWKNKQWKKVYDLADTYVKRLADGEHDSTFYQKDAAFKAHHIFMLQKQMYRKNYPGLMAELAVTDKKAVANVAAMLTASKNKDGPRSAKAFVKKNKLSMKPSEVIKKIKKAFKIR